LGLFFIEIVVFGRKMGKFGFVLHKRADLSNILYWSRGQIVKARNSNIETPFRVISFAPDRKTSELESRVNFCKIAIIIVKLWFHEKASSLIDYFLDSCFHRNDRAKRISAGGEKVSPL
jgi:hypothetical protein